MWDQSGCFEEVTESASKFEERNDVELEPNYNDKKLLDVCYSICNSVRWTNTEFE